MPDVTKGSFMTSLKRSNKEIREDRALSIAKATETVYRRYLEDLQADKEELERQRTNLLDLSPDNATSLKLASNHNAADFLKRDEQIGIEMRKIDIKIEIVGKRYKELFGGDQREVSETNMAAIIENKEE